MGDGFIKMIKMVIAPIIFCTVVSGIAHIQDAKKVGRIGVKALIYFEVVSTFALVLGLIVGNVVRPGAGFGGAAAANAQAVAGYAKQAEAQKSVDFILHIIPDTVVGAFAQGEILQVLFFSILFGFAVMSLGERGHTLRSFVDDAAHGVFGVISIVMRAAPIGAFGAMAYTIGKFGTGAILNLLGLILTFYVTAALFVFVVLGIIARFAGFSIFQFLAYIKDELLIVLGTSSSESALPSLMEKLERLGCSKSVVGLVVPTGYSFNLDGTNIYMTLATLFIAQALGFDLSLGQQITILLVAMLTSKGASGITGAGFITLAATLAVVDPRLVPGMAIVLGIDKFMSECRALTNLCGNGVACVVVAWWEGELDRDKLKANLSKEIDPTDMETAITTG
jgi:aerobic C4-dicarboxylate transport protein